MICPKPSDQCECKECFDVRQAEFSKFLKRASAEVAKWPRWKQSCLGWGGLETKEPEKAGE